jgi:hypothetical protein
MRAGSMKTSTKSARAVVKSGGGQAPFPACGWEVTSPLLSPREPAEFGTLTTLAIAGRLWPDDLVARRPCGRRTARTACLAVHPGYEPSRGTKPQFCGGVTIVPAFSGIVRT